jgi:purine-binding chemotaxis protein CheW
MSEEDAIQQVLQARARLFAQRAARASEQVRTPRNRALVLSAGGEQYALGVEDVRQIGTPRGVTPLPGAPASLAGIANLRGAVYSVIDLAQIFTGTRSPENGRLIFLRTTSVRIALLVEDVESIVLFDEVRPLEAAAAHLAGMIPPALPLISISALLRHPAFTPGRTPTL